MPSGNYNTMKKVAILLPWLKMGGTNKVAINFINELSQYCEVTLILTQNTGELLENVNGNIQVLIDKMVDYKELVKTDLKGLCFKNILQDIHYYRIIKSGKDSIDNYKYIVDRTRPVTEEEFDCAISYHGQSPERLLNLLYRIKAKKKVAWIHGEMSFSQDKCKRLRKYYNQVDYLFFVSGPTKESFQRIIPFDEKKAVIYYNPIDKQDILQRSLEAIDIEWDETFSNLVTVGRISSEKGQDMVPLIVRKLLDRGHSVRWYLIGDGNDRKRIEKLCAEYDVESSVIFTGVKTNPYVYMKACDLYIQPSYTEGFSTTICEAAILGKAIIGTEPSGGIRDQITDGYDGMIVKAEPDAIADAIEELLDNHTLKEQFEERIVLKDFEGKGEIQKFLAIMET